MGSQSTAKTIFLLASMVGWLIVGASLMYLFPLVADRLVSSDLTHLWMENLSHSGYNPMLAWVGGGITLYQVGLNAHNIRRCHSAWNRRCPDDSPSILTSALMS